MQTMFDLSIPLTDALSVYPGDEPPHLRKVNDLGLDGFNNFHLSATMHTGTHIDGPMHLTKSGTYINELPLECFVGRGCVINAFGKNSIQKTSEYELIVRPHSIVLLYTGMSRFFGSKEYFTKYPIVSTEFAQLLIERQVKMLCLDSPSPDRDPFDIHKLLLENNVLLAENLTNFENLLTIDSFEVIALPLKIYADSSPARIIARTLE
jgi:kynurenine formamidase